MQNACAIPTNVCSILAFGLLPFTPTDCREALITMVQVMPELASIIEVGIYKNVSSTCTYTGKTGMI